MHPSLDSCPLPGSCWGPAFLTHYGVWVGQTARPGKTGHSARSHLRAHSHGGHSHGWGEPGEGNNGSEPEFRGSGATGVTHELVSGFMADWTSDANGVNQILFSGHIEPGLGGGRVESPTEEGSGQAIEWTTDAEGRTHTFLVASCIAAPVLSLHSALFAVFLSTAHDMLYM